ncbi:hypothetical protein [Paenibacillus sp. NPDC058071]|uniref:hypothetical protein n=1 Tax=Paenibacillus sp. NPDC058071 TaxID=3346326 RepID=UPI0036D9F211
MVEALFATPAHLRPGQHPADGEAGTSAAAETAPHAEPFTEPCPACEETVTERHIHCPACGLRLL